MSTYNEHNLSNDFEEEMEEMEHLFLYLIILRLKMIFRT